MEQEKKRLMLDRPHIRQACSEAMKDPKLLQSVLEQIYREGFEDTPAEPDSDRRLADSAQGMYDEVAQQLGNCRRDLQKWLTTVQQDCVDEEDVSLQAVTNGLCALAAQRHLVKKEETYKRLLEHLASEEQEESTPETLRRRQDMLEKFFETPMSGLFYTLKSYPLLDEEHIKSAACLLAMAGYVDMKRNDPQDSAPDISFDAVCVMSSIMTKLMCAPRSELESAQMAACVCFTMCSQYMWVVDSNVMMDCLTSLSGKIRENMQKLSELTKGLEPQQGEHIEICGKNTEYDFVRQWKQLLPLEEGGAVQHRENPDGQKLKWKQPLTVKEGGAVLYGKNSVRQKTK